MPGSETLRTGKDCGISKFPSTSMAMNKAWLAAALTSCRPVVRSAHQVPSSLGGMLH
jgi:hypothetical protein